MTLSLIYIRDFLFCLEHYAWLGSSGFQDLFGTKISWLLNISTELCVLSSPCTTWYPWIDIVSYMSRCWVGSCMRECFLLILSLDKDTKIPFIDKGVLLSCKSNLCEPKNVYNYWYIERHINASLAILNIL